jgi:hypothetical protein
VQVAGLISFYSSFKLYVSQTPLQHRPSTSANDIKPSRQPYRLCASLIPSATPLKIYPNPYPLQNESFGWHLQFLTIIGITLSTACFGCGLVADITGSQTFFMYKNYLSLVAAPIEIVISILYWGLRAIDTSLVLPPDMFLPPLAADIAFHLTPAVVLAIDAILLSPPWPTSPMNSQAPLLTLLSSTGVVFAYWWWIVRISCL